MKSNKFSPEVRERAVRMVQGAPWGVPSLWAGDRIDCTEDRCGAADAARVGQARRGRQRRSRRRDDQRGAAYEGARREVKELRRANEILKLASAFFAQAELDRRLKSWRDFIDKHRATFGVEPICKVLQVAPSGYRRHAALLREPHRRCARAQRDDALMPAIQRVWQANMQV